MNLLGVKMTMLIGPTVVMPAPLPLTEALDRVEVTHTDEGRSCFQIVFKVGRSGPMDFMDYSLLSLPLLQPKMRVVLVVWFNCILRVLMDGLITHQELKPGSEPGQSLLTVIGEDVSSAMDTKELSMEHPAQDETIIAFKLIAMYAQYGMIPMVIPPLAIDPPLPIDRIPVQQGTDLQYLKAMAKRHGYIFYVEPGPLPATNTAYWGPPIRVGLPQRALTTNMGAQTNVEKIDFKYNARAATMVSGTVQDRMTNMQLKVQTFASLRLPPLAAMPHWLLHMADVRIKQQRYSGLTFIQAMARAQGEMDASNDAVVTGTGELDAMRYGDMLRPHGLVGVRGAGWSYDGFYYVKCVTHKIKKGEYKQSFTITREGLGAILPVVVP